MNAMKVNARTGEMVAANEAAAGAGVREVPGLDMMASL
jgi:hypothetical protein